MSNLFEQLMTENRQVSGTKKSSAPAKAVVESAKKISAKKIKVESLKILEDADLDELETQFAVDPEDSAEDEVVLVIDPEISAEEDVPEDAAEDMVGDKVYKCPVCGGNYVCDCDAAHNESLEVDEDGIPTECPICGDDADQILIGEIAPVEDAGDPAPSQDPVDTDDANDEDDLPLPENDDDVDNDDDDTDDTQEESVKKETLDLNTDNAKDNARDDDLSIDDSKLEMLVNKMIRENYKANPLFRVTKASSNGSSLKLEYVVRTKGKSPIKGVWVAEGFNANERKMSLKFRDKGAFTESFTRRPAFTLECVRIGSKIIPTSLKYNYTKKVNESVYRVVGSCK